MNYKSERFETDYDGHGQYTAAYIKILNAYQKQINDSVQRKNELKSKFFGLIRLIMIILMGLFIVSIFAAFTLMGLMIYKNYQSVAVITGAVTTVLSTFVTMLISIFKLPQIIADYLFNKEEDQMMNEIIKNIQRYELDAVRIEKENKKILNDEKEREVRQNKESFFDDSPNIKGKQPEDLKRSEAINISD